VAAVAATAAAAVAVVYVMPIKHVSGSRGGKCLDKWWLSTLWGLGGGVEGRPSAGAVSAASGRVVQY
jgi:hypothetical protein